MSLLIQDAIVTLFSAGAAVLLLQRLASVVRPRGADRKCAGCSHCPSPQRPASIRSIAD